MPARPFLTALLLLASAASLGAQAPATTGPTQRGSLLVAGSADISHASGSRDGDDFTSITLSPNVLAFVRPGLALGGSLILGRIGFDDGHITEFGVGPAGRYYFGGGARRVLPFVGVALLYAHSSLDQRSGLEGSTERIETTNSSWDVDGALGLTGMLSRQVGLTGEAYLRREVANIDSNFGGIAEQEQRLTRFGLRFGISAFIF